MGKHMLHTAAVLGRLREPLQSGQTEQVAGLAMKILLETLSCRHRHRGYGSCQTKGRWRMRICDHQ